MNDKKVTLPKLKRLFDIIFSLTFLIITLPISILILAAIFSVAAIGGSPYFTGKKEFRRGKNLTS